MKYLVIADCIVGDTKNLMSQERILDADSKYEAVEQFTDIMLSHEILVYKITKVEVLS